MKAGRKVTRKRETPPSALAKAVYATRLKRGWSQADFAQVVGCHTKLIQTVERGLRPSFVMLLTIGQYTEGEEREAIVEELRKMAPFAVGWI
jgi:transcriptional regulator with XRE-family HTH domain